jgi:hypothetical protein
MVANAGVATVIASAMAATVAGRRGRIAADRPGRRRSHGVVEIGVGESGVVLTAGFCHVVIKQAAFLAAPGTMLSSVPGPTMELLTSVS